MACSSASARLCGREGEGGYIYRPTGEWVGRRAGAGVAMVTGHQGQLVSAQWVVYLLSGTVPGPPSSL